MKTGSKSTWRRKFKVEEKKSLVTPAYTGARLKIILTNGAECVLLYPNDITINDIKIINHYLDQILLRIRIQDEESSTQTS